MSTPALNPLVTKIRAAYPGAYDDMDDATLTKSVLAKYPQYSDLAAPPVPNPRQQLQMQSNETLGTRMMGGPSNTPGIVDPYAKVPKKPQGVGQPYNAGGKVPQSIQNSPDYVGESIAGMTALGALGANPVASAAVRKITPAIVGGAKAGAGFAATEAVVQGAKKLPFLGEYVSKIPGIDYLPFLVGMGGTAKENGEIQPKGKPEGRMLGPEAPTPELVKSQELSNLPATGAKPVAQTVEALAQIRQKLNMEPTPQAPPITKKAVGSLLEKGLDAAPPPEPGKPIYQGPKPAAAIEHTPVQSSALKSFAYDPAQKELHIATNSNPNTVYVYGDVAPEQADALATAESKGKAYGDFRKSGSPLVAKIIDGKRVAVKPTTRPQSEPTATPDNQLVDMLKKSVAQAKGMAAD